VLDQIKAQLMKLLSRPGHLVEDQDTSWLANVETDAHAHAPPRG
jgi:hypothetical protein